MDNFYADTRVGLWIPMVGSLYSGLLAALAGLTLGLLADADRLALWALVSGVGGAALTFWGLLAAWKVAAFPTQEAQAQPVVKQSVTQLVVHSDEGRRGDVLTFAGVTPEQLHTLADGLASGAPLSVSYWCGRSGAFSRSEFERMRQVLIDRGLVRARGRGPQQGFELTLAGSHAFKALARTAPPGATRPIRLTAHAG